MITQSETDKLIDTIYSLSFTQFIAVRGKDVILLMGKTGNGKSALLNMIAGSKITAKRNLKSRIWQLEANPEVAMIGHGVSMTFVPNYWEGKHGIIYDCAGFNDNRGLEFEIVKSFFIKQIVQNAKSIKIIIVADYHTICGSRCAPLEECLNQMKDFIPNFSPQEDCSFIVPKIPRDEEGLEAEHIAEIIKQRICIQLNPSKIYLLWNPQKNGSYEFDMNFQQIFASAPTLIEKCNIALSIEAKLRLLELCIDLNNSIERTARTYSRYIKLYYLQVIAKNLQAPNADIQRICNLFKEVEQNIKQSQTPEGFLANLRSSSKQLQQTFRILFKYEPICNFIEKKINQMSFLRDKAGNFETTLQHWLNNINFQCPTFVKSDETSNMKNIQAFRTFLRNSVNINIDSNIKVEAHAYLIGSRNIVVPYSGSQQINGILTHSGRCKKKFDIPYVAEETYRVRLPYNDSVKIQVTKQVKSSVQVRNCNCGYKVFGFSGLCKNCSHHYIHIPYSTMVNYNKNLPYSGTIDKTETQRYSYVASFQKQEIYNVSQTYKEYVPFTGTHTGCCSDHHRCSCLDLAQVVFSAKEQFENIQFYEEFIRAQLRQIQNLQNSNLAEQNQENEAIALLSIFRFEGQQLTNRQISKVSLARIIHNNLSHSSTFSSLFNGSTPYKIQKTYNVPVRFKGQERVHQTINFKKQYQYSEVLNYSEYVDYSGYVDVHSCYEGCWACNDSVSSKYYSGKCLIEGQQMYKGSKQYQEVREYNSYVNYDEEVSNVGTLEKLENVAYNGTVIVTCENGSSVGDGHHSCTSCDTWEKFVNGLRQLLRIKEAKINRIAANQRIIQSLS